MSPNGQADAGQPDDLDTGLPGLVDAQVDAAVMAVDEGVIQPLQDMNIVVMNDLGIDSEEYPDGPFGRSAGDTIENLSF